MRTWSDQAIWGMVAVTLLSSFIIIGTTCYTKGVTDTIKEAQRAAVIAGAARWSSNRETGEAQFDYVTCLKPEAK